MVRFAVLAFVLMPSTLSAQDEWPGYDSAVLLGIESIKLGPTAIVAEEVEELTGVSEEWVQRRVRAILELEFRRAGLLVDSSSGVTVIYTLDAKTTPGGAVAYTQNLQIWELTDRLRTPNVESDQALTWRFGGLVYVTQPDVFQRAIEEGARYMADDFLIHYLRANPR